ncbi:phosphatidylserine decarboxylase [Sulfurimonas hongkongensis]|uniref:phosphatidylserine decarboxylase n=1 Tax=Sulfurimonas hongkongensis TaxID=1172190 RepID=T0KCN3_9BACT|nr:phosphatidylserine decarboxylase [Sulfurimonas hongkongensis]EQB34489.1 phosphatidylserine decarboxylase [Sulfurimonas hongkongensis]
MSKHITSAISQIFGKFANKEFSKWFQKIVNSSYVGLMGLDMQEFHTAESYKSLNALFTRKLKEDRTYSLDGDDFISPCDSLVSACGKLQKDYALQIKGMRYSSDELLGEHFSSDEKKSVYNGEFINFYLSPKDYHRYHIPTNLKVLKAVHIPGRLYPVNIPSLKKRLNLFIENERVVLMCENSSGKRFFIVLVGALNVGVMQISFESAIKTNASATESSVYEYEDLYLNKGDDFGCFEMGSTIVILAQKDMLELKDLQSKDVKYGETIARNV